MDLTLTNGVRTHQCWCAQENVGSIRVLNSHIEECEIICVSGGFGLLLWVVTNGIKTSQEWCAGGNAGSPTKLNPHIRECENLSLLAVDLNSYKWYHNQSSSGVSARKTKHS